jgi:repressor LexA
MERKNPTDRQKAVLECIENHVARFGFPPTVREIGSACGLRSPRSVSQHLDALEHKGFIRRTKDKSRAIEITGPAGRSGERRGAAKRPTSSRDAVMIPLIGNVQAGAPTLAEEDLEITYALDERLFGEGEAFLLRARGESMTGAHIVDGDLLVVRPGGSPESGDIVVALIDSDATVKRYVKRRGKSYLQPAHEGMKTISLSPRNGTIRIVGKVIGVIRRIR